jgi:hypothetical protein
MSASNKHERDPGCSVAADYHGQPNHDQPIAERGQSREHRDDATAPAHGAKFSLEL